MQTDIYTNRRLFGTLAHKHFPFLWPEAAEEKIQSTLAIASTVVNHFEG